MNKLKKDIQKIKKRLIDKASKSGIYENFGQKEISLLHDSYIDISNYSEEMNLKRRLIANFNEWVISYNGGL